MGRVLAGRWLVFLLIISVSLAAAQETTKDRLDYQNSGSYNTPEIELETLTLSWTFRAGNWIQTTPLAADLDGDGRLEIIFGSDDGSLYVFGANRNKMWEYPTKKPIKSTPTVEDIDEDGRKEIIFGSDDGFLYVLTAEGRVKWTYEAGEKIRGAAVAADLDPGPGTEIVFGAEDGKVYLLNAYGRKIKDFELNGEIQSTPAIHDVDGDGRADIVVGCSNYNLYLLGYPDPKRTSYLTGGKINGAPAVSGPYIVVGSEDGKIYGLRYEEYEVAGTKGYKAASLNSAWTLEVGGEPTSAALEPLVSGSGYDTAVVGSEKNLYILNAYTGELIKKYSTNARITAAPVIAPTTEGKAVLFGSDDGMIYAVNTSWVAAWKHKCGGPVKASPTVADLDGDGKVELLVACGETLNVFSSNPVPQTTTTTTLYEEEEEAEETTTTTTAAVSTTTTRKQVPSTIVVLEQEKEPEAVAPATGNVLSEAVNAGLTLLVLFLIAVVAYVLKNQNK